MLRRRKSRIVQFIDEVIVCGIRLRRHTLPNGKRVFEEEGIRELLLFATEPPTLREVERFEQFVSPEARH